MSRAGVGVFPPLPPSAYLRRPRASLPFPLDDPDCRVFRLARQGLAAGVQAIGLKPDDEILVPAYHHGSEVEALARAGLGCRFYEATETLEPDADELDALLGPRVRALHLIHCLGFPQDALRWRRWCDDRDLLLVEDAAQAWLAQRDAVPSGSLGDLAIFSLYKTVGVPDGGATICSRPLAAPTRGHRLGAVRLAKANLSRLALRWPRPRSPNDGLPAAARSIVPREFEIGDLAARPSTLTGPLVRRAIDGDTADRRRRNYRFLLGRLRDWVPPPFGDLPAGASPFAFPVAVRDKRSLLEALAASGVAALDFWSVPHPKLRPGDFPGATARRSTTVGLPVHQELLASHLADLAGVVASRSEPVPRSVGS